MKRDMDLVRKILLRSAEKPDGRPSRDVAFEGYSEEMVAYHIHLLCEAGLLDGITPRPTNSGRFRTCLIGNLTWRGNEFVDAAAKETTWEKAKALVASKGLDMTFALAVEALKRVTLGALG